MSVTSVAVTGHEISRLYDGGSNDNVEKSSAVGVIGQVAFFKVKRPINTGTGRNRSRRFGTLLEWRWIDGGVNGRSMGCSRSLDLPHQLKRIWHQIRFSRPRHVFARVVFHRCDRRLVSHPVVPVWGTRNTLCSLFTRN